MSITLSRRRRVRSESAEQEESANVPPVLPVVTMTVQANATLRVVVDGKPFGPPTFAPPWQRHSFAQIISEVIEQRRSPVRVVMHELDGTVYTDIVTAPLHPASLDQSPAELPPASVEHDDLAPDDAAPLHPLALQNAEGFVPGEEVAVAVIVRHTGAGREGAARALIEPGLLDLSPTHEVILLGRVSGTCIVGHPA
ncbi:hypothetical protein [uncultured Microbacterium sp.]|uniref:hypothetical protein n=1 Tax=uncultured Microbacterium sp. TaxID=191216 RepID=UPI0025FD4AB5|nr:hypothetical protein [uncultured Microbacterium sp.]